MFPGSPNPFGSSPVPARLLPPTSPPSPPSAESAGILVILLPGAKKRHRFAQSELSFLTVPPTDVLTRAVRKEAFRNLE